MKQLIKGLQCLSSSKKQTCAKSEAPSLKISRQCYEEGLIPWGVGVCMHASLHNLPLEGPVKFLLTCRVDACVFDSQMIAFSHGRGLKSQRSTRWHFCCILDEMSAQPIQEIEIFLPAFRVIISCCANDLFHLVCPSRIINTPYCRKGGLFVCKWCNSFTEVYLNATH